MFRLSCAAPNCQMRTYNFSDEQSKLAKSNYVVSFHKFPTDPEQRKAWIEAAKQSNWKPADNNCLCSLHFRDDCFDQNNQLYDHAVPTIFFTDFRAYIKSIIKNINLEVDLESEESDPNEDILSKSLKNLSPVNSEIDEVIEYELAVSDDDFEIECQEVFGTKDDDDNNEKSFEKCTINENSLNSDSKSIEKSIISGPISKEPVFNIKMANVIPKKSSFSNVKQQNKELKENIPDISIKDRSINNISVSKPNESNLKNIVSTDVKNLKSKHISETSENAKKLFSMIKSGSFNKFSVMQPASRDLVQQLLNIVKLANSQNTAFTNMDGSVPNTYIITTKLENDCPNIEKKIKSMETSEVVSIIMNMVKSIKNGTFQKTKEISIICGSPAIFLIKNVVVKNFDRNMNSVYVITSENLLPYLCQSTVKIESDSSSSTSLINTSKILMKTSDTIAQPSKITTTKPNSFNLTTTSPSVTSLTTKLNFSPSISKISSISKIIRSPAISLSTTPKQQNTVCSSQNTRCFPTSHINLEKRNVTTTNIKSFSTFSDANSVRSKKDSNLESPVSSDTSFLRQSMFPKIIPCNSKSPITKLTSSVKTAPIIISQPYSLLKKDSLTSNFSPSQLTNTSVNENGGQNILKKNLTSPSNNLANTHEFATTNVLEAVGLQPYIKKPSVFPSVITADNEIEKTTKNVSQKRKFEEKSTISADSLESKPKKFYNIDYLEKQKNDIQNLERNIIKKESEIVALRKKIQKLKKRYNSVKNPADAKTDEQMVEDILKKYLDHDAVQFFVGQMKVSGKTYTQFRWTEDDKLFALGLLYKNPVEYHILFQRFTLPSDKTLNKFVARIKKAEQDTRR